MSGYLLFFQKLILLSIKKLWRSTLDLVPIIGVVVFFQVIVLRQPFPDLQNVLIGLAFVIVGLTLFVEGLELGLFPIGENLAYSLSQKGSLFWLLVFAFAFGFSTSIAEPALIAVAKEASEVMALEGVIQSDYTTSFALHVRLAVALAVGLAIVIGVFRILKGWPIHYIFIGGYVLVMGVTVFAPKEIVGLAYDAGVVTTSTITVPLVTALGVGLAKVIKNRSPLLDGFGLIALASILPMIAVMLYAIFFM
jgi:uncharacterized membrane protein (DUF2068 family)